MNEEKLLKIKKEIVENVGWLENGKDVGLSDATISTIMSIIRINLTVESKADYNAGFVDGIKTQQDIIEKQFQLEMKQLELEQSE